MSMKDILAKKFDLETEIFELICEHFSTEPQGPARAGQEPGETGGPRCASRQTGATQVRPSWLFPFPMEYKGRRKPDAQEDGGVREGDFFEGLRS
jgi:hypothetical protein